MNVHFCGFFFCFFGVFLRTIGQMKHLHEAHDICLDVLRDYQYGKMHGFDLQCFNLTSQKLQLTEGLCAALVVVWFGFVLL